FAAIDGRLDIFFLVSEHVSSNVLEIMLNSKDNTIGGTPLHFAILNHRTELIKLLCKCVECDVNIQDFEGNIPLHCAIRLQMPDIPSLLISAGSDLSIKNNEGLTPEELAKSLQITVGETKNDFIEI